MEIVKTIEEVRNLVRKARAECKSIGLVPTMGALHEGHLSLIDSARADTDFVVVSIFLNPTQFGPNEDLEAYPRPIEADLKACEEKKVDVVFTPTAETMYGQEGLTKVSVGKLGDALCGKSRPTHFSGVCTVVAKLFNIVLPDKAFFGAKDFQQSVIIARMVEDLNFPVEIVVCPTIREKDGLAKSSRNSYLSDKDRQQATELYQSLLKAQGLIREKRPTSAEVISAMKEHLSPKAPDGEIDYIQIVDPKTLSDVENTDKPVVIALAVKFGNTRLIDNILVD